MNNFFVVATFQSVHGFNGKAGHVAGLPPLTAFNGFHGALAHKLNREAEMHLRPTGLSVAFSRVELRKGQTTYAWTAISRKANGGRAKPAPMADQVEGDGVFHMIFGFENDSEEPLAIGFVEKVWSSMRLAGGEMPISPVRQAKRGLEIVQTYDEALSKIPGGAWMIEDATSDFRTFLALRQEKSGFANLLAFTKWVKKAETEKTGEADGEQVDAEAQLGNGGNVMSEKPESAMADVSAEPDADATMTPPEQDPEDKAFAFVQTLPTRLPLVVGWRLLTDATEKKSVSRFPGAKTAMAEPVHGVVFLRLCAAIRNERRLAHEDQEGQATTPATWFEWKWRSVAGRPAGLMTAVEH